MTNWRRARVRVPCSTSNLGAGFDCLGLALDRYLRAEFLPGPESLTVERTGSATPVTTDRDYLFACFVEEIERLGHTRPTGRLIVESEIPLGRGLGSSAAAVVAGLALAHAALGATRVDPAVLLPLAEAREGHPDNVAPALLGGLVAAARAETASPYGHVPPARLEAAPPHGVATPTDAGGTPAHAITHAFRLPLSDRLGFVFAAPDVEVPTPLARRALPDRVTHDTATRALGRVAALVHGLASGDDELLRIGFTDELHVPYRAALIPGATLAFAAARQAGAIAVTISGSGSGLIAVCRPGQEADIASALVGALQTENEGDVMAFALQPDGVGATLERAYD